MKLHLTILVLFLIGCQTKEEKLLNEYVLDMWIHENLLLDEALGDFKKEQEFSRESEVLISYIDTILSKLKGFPSNQNHTYDDLIALDSLLDYKTNTNEFYGQDFAIPIIKGYSFLNLKVQIEHYLNLEENKTLGEIIFPRFRNGKFQNYDEWSWEAKTFYNVPLIQLVVEMKEIKLRINQIEKIRTTKRQQHI